MYSLESLPPAYGENTLVALVQGPGVVFVYWELSPEMWRLFAAGRPVLRMYETSGKETTTFAEVPLEWYTGNYYFRRVCPGRIYQGTLGLWEGTTFYSYLCSGRVATPPVEIAAVAGRRLMVPMPFKVFQRADAPGSYGFSPGGEDS